MYFELFIKKGTDIQTEWLKYIQEIDRKLKKALQNSVKVSLHELQKHIKGDTANMGQIFRIDLVLDTKDNDQDQLPMKHDPDFPKLKQAIATFVKDIIECTRVVNKVETVFREDRKFMIQKKFKEDIELEKNGGGNQTRSLEWKNMSEEDKLKVYIKEHELPGVYKKGRDYVEKIYKENDIENCVNTITACVENVKQILDTNVRDWKT